MRSKLTLVFVGIGSNLQQPQAQVVSAIAAIASAKEMVLEGRSPLYSSPPMGPPDQPNYVNAVVKLSTRLNSSELLDRLQKIEREHGRNRNHIHWGPRTLDLDILLFGNETIHSDQLTVPHPGMLDRAFVIIPLADIAADLILPNGIRADAMARRLRHKDLNILADE